MILRRFTEHIKAQNWFAVFLDLLVVVVGIYIGLQADAWMGARADRQLEREYLERLLADMEESIDAQSSAHRVYDESIAATNDIARIQRSGDFDEISEERIVTGLNSVGWVGPVVTNMSTIRELQSTGNIGLIQDVSIRTAIGKFERSYAIADFTARQNIEFMAAAAPEYMTWSYMESKTPGEHRSVTEDEDDSYGYVHRWDMERILKNPDGARITSWVAGWGAYHGAVLAQHHKDTIEFRDLLRERLIE